VSSGGTVMVSSWPGFTEIPVTSGAPPLMLFSLALTMNWYGILCSFVKWMRDDG
jgi:hypothetical protein